MFEQRRQTPIAIVGLAALLPGSPDVANFWSNLVEGADLITDVPPDRWLVADFYDPDPAAPDHTYCRRGALLPEVDFDTAVYGIPPTDLSATDTSQLLSLLVADRALADAGGLSSLDRERVSVIIGAGQLELVGQMAHRLERPVWRKALREHGMPESQVQAVCDRITDHYLPWQEATFPGLLTNVIAGRIANRFDLHGTNCTADAACASSFAALAMGVDELEFGRADLVLTGGVDTVNDPFAYVCFSKTPALSPSGDCRPFADTADGTQLGEALVMFVLKRLTDAERDQDRIYAVIRGLGSSSDGRGGAIYAPVPAGQARALRRAYASAGYEPDTVELVEAHGTGTRAGDAAEFAALREVFAATGRTDRQWCALGSVKSQLGHTKSAAGAVGLLKAVLALHHKVLPPTIKVDRPSAELAMADSAFYLNTATRPWVTAGTHPRRAAVSSFGFGGTNFHVTVEEYTGDWPAQRYRAVPTELVLASGEHPAELLALRDRDECLSELARGSQSEFNPAAPHRLALVVTDLADLRSTLDGLADRLRQHPDQPVETPDGVWYGAGPSAAGQTAFLFPGQGSQYVGMSGELTMHVPLAQRVWDRAASWQPGLRDVVFPPPAFTERERADDERRLTATEWAQPALATHSLVLLELLRSLGIRPNAMAGHSFGELVALHAAGVFDDAGLLRLARRRGELMRDAAPESGAMLAAFADAKEVAAMLVAAGLADVWVANHNGPAGVVLSGTVAAIDACARMLAESGITVRRLNTATGFHCPLVAPATSPLRDFLGDLRVDQPSLTVYGNAHAAPYPDDPDEIRRLVAEQIAAPVRFADTIEAMYLAGIRTFIEVGAGATLTGMVGRILAGRRHTVVPTDRRGRHGVTSLHRTLARLAAQGVPVNFAPLWEHHTPAPAGSGPSGTAVRISGGNHGRRYPPPGGAAALPPPNPETSAPDDRPSPAHESTIDGEWLQAVAQAHETYQRVMADSHLAYLSLARAALASGASVPGVPALPTDPLPTPLPALPRPDQSFPQPAAPGGDAAVLVGEPSPTDRSTEIDIGHTVLTVVAEKTGYPIEVIGADLDIEADLGIDSIKRVEILSELRERLPGLAQLTAAGSGPATELINIRTIDELVRRLGPALTATPRAEQTAAAQPAEPRESLIRRVVRAVPAVADGRCVPGLGGGPVVVTDDNTGIADLVVDRLRARGFTASVVVGLPADARRVILLDGLRHVGSPDDAMAVQRAAFQAARTVAPGFGRDGGVLVTVQDTGGDFGLRGADADRAWLGGLAALARTAAREWPLASVKAIDCERAGRGAADVAEAIVAELCTGGDSPDVGLRADGTRTILVDIDAGVAEPAGSELLAALGPEPVLIVTGGARGITAQAVRALAEHRPRLALFGRTHLATEPPDVTAAGDEPALVRLFLSHGDPPAQAKANTTAVLAAREARRMVAELERAGATVRYVTVDVTDRNAVADAVARLHRDWGLITGIVHGAGVLADKRIGDKTDDDFDLVFGTKVAGLRNVLTATATDPLRLLCGFSSVTARFGNAGQCDYTMANETLTHVLAAEAVRRPGCTVRSLLWGPWSGGMVSGELARYFRDSGVHLIQDGVGGAAFAAEVVAGEGPVAVTLTAGELPLPAEPATDTRVIRVSDRSHDYLADHAIAGVPVVPVATVLDWFTAAAGSWLPGEPELMLRNLRVLHRIDLSGLRNGGHRLEIRGSKPRLANGHVLDLELLDDGGKPCYRAHVASTSSDSPVWTLPADLLPLARREIYDGTVLFHGPRCHAVRAVDGVGRGGAAGTVLGAADLGWAGDGRWLDPAAVDGGLQLALLWAEHVIGTAALPMGVAECRPHRAGVISGPATCLVRATRIGSDDAECDVGVLNPDGTPGVELLGVHLVRRPRAQERQPGGRPA